MKAHPHALRQPIRPAMTPPLTYACPSCGTEVQVGGVCPGCPRPKPKKRKAMHAHPKHAWEQDSAYDGLDLPEEDFDYDEFVAREFHGAPHRRLGVKWYWWAIGVGILILFALGAIRVCWG